MLNILIVDLSTLNVLYFDIGCIDIIVNCSVFMSYTLYKEDGRFII